MLKSKSLQERQTGLLTELNTLASKDRSARTESEATRFTELEKEISGLGTEISAAKMLEEHARQQAKNGQSLSDNDKKDIGKYRFLNAIRASVDRTALTGVEAEMHTEAVREMTELGQTVKGHFAIPSMVIGSRASTGQNVTTAADGGNLVTDMPVLFYSALQDALIMLGMGATYLTGLVGNLPLSGIGSFNAAFVGENDEVSYSKTGFSKRDLSPKRVGAAGAISKQLLIQTSVGVESMIRTALAEALARALQTAIINGDGTGANPLGILNAVGAGSVAIGTNGGALSHPLAVAVETVVGAANGLTGSLSYLTNSKVVGELKTTKTDAGSGRFLLENGMLNGYKVNATNAVPSDLSKGTGTNLSALIFGNWKDLIIGSWGAMDVVVDPYTLSKKNEIGIVVNQFHDVGVKRVGSFAHIKDIVTAVTV